jgi:hypothetical protein
MKSINQQQGGYRFSRSANEKHARDIRTMRLSHLVQPIITPSNNAHAFVVSPLRMHRYTPECMTRAEECSSLLTCVKTCMDMVSITFPH